MGAVSGSAETGHLWKEAVTAAIKASSTDSVFSTIRSMEGGVTQDIGYAATFIAKLLITPPWSASIVKTTMLTPKTVVEVNLDLFKFGSHFFQNAYHLFIQLYVDSYFFLFNARVQCITRKNLR